jgi:WXXGXW repeat (2 copies)
MRARSLKVWLAALAAGAGLSAAVLLSVPESVAQPPPSGPQLGEPAAVPAAPAAEQLAEPPVPKGVEVQTRGPIHEAYASPTDEAQATTPVAKAPPKAIEEMPPDEKPEGNPIWIGGYWAWDQDRNNYLWVSGLWRVPPPNKHWVAGYWREDSDKWQWVPGFWAESQQDTEKHDVTYLPSPPAAPETAAPGAPPNADSFYVPGQYVWRADTGAYGWRAGYWARVQPGYVWVPAHFRWSPYGYIYIAGYWDLAIAGRGVLYAPVVIEPEVVTVGFVYRPTYVVHSTIVLDAFWVRPCYCHYYYGDYYGGVYTDGGFVSVAVYNQRHYDCVFVYERWNHREDPRWATVQINIYNDRFAGRAVRPPRTIVEYNRYGHERGLAIASGPRVAEMHGTRMVRMEAAERARVVAHAQAARQVATERRVAEAKMTPGAPRQPRTASVAMPKGYAAPKPPSTGREGTGQGSHPTPPPGGGSHPQPGGGGSHPPQGAGTKPPPAKPQPPAKPKPPPAKPSNNNHPQQHDNR